MGYFLSFFRFPMSWSLLRRLLYGSTVFVLSISRRMRHTTTGKRRRGEARGRLRARMDRPQREQVADTELSWRHALWRVTVVSGIADVRDGCLLCLRDSCLTPAPVMQAASSFAIRNWTTIEMGDMAVVYCRLYLGWLAVDLGVGYLVFACFPFPIACPARSVLRSLLSIALNVCLVPGCLFFVWLLRRARAGNMTTKLKVLVLCDRAESQIVSVAKIYEMHL